MKKILAIILAMIMVFALSSCQLSEYFGDKKNEPVDTTLETGDKVNTSTDPADYIPEGVDVNYIMDYMNEDLSAYITLGEYKGISVEVETYEITDEFVEEELEAFLESCATPSKITDRKTADGDTICVDYVGSLDGVEFSGGSAKNVTISLTEDNGYIPGFIDGMYDVMPGETVSYEVTFPEVYQNNPDLAGKVTVFTVTVHYIEGEDVVPELNDEYVKENFGTEGCETVEDFMKYYREFLAQEREEQIKVEATEEIWSNIMENATLIEVPEKSVEAIYWQIRANAEVYAASYGISYETFLSYNGTSDEEQKAYAVDYITEDLVMFSIIKAEDMDITEEQYEADLIEYAEKNGVTAEYLAENYPKEQIKNVFRWNRLMEAIYEWSSVTAVAE